MQNIDQIIKTYCEQLPVDDAIFNWKDVMEIVANACKTSFRLGQRPPLPNSKPKEEDAAGRPLPLTEDRSAKSPSVQFPISDSIGEKILINPSDLKKRPFRLPDDHLAAVGGIFVNQSVNALAAANRWVEKIKEDLETLREEVCEQALIVPALLLDRLQTKLEALEDEVINLHDLHMPNWRKAHDESAGDTPNDSDD